MRHVGLLRALGEFPWLGVGGVGIVEVDFALGDARFEIVELGE